jgi:hypothetical protein
MVGREFFQRAGEFPAPTDPEYPMASSALRESRLRAGFESFAPLSAKSAHRSTSPRKRTQSQSTNFCREGPTAVIADIFHCDTNS